MKIIIFFFAKVPIGQPNILSSIRNREVDQIYLERFDLRQTTDRKMELKSGPVFVILILYSSIVLIFGVQEWNVTQQFPSDQLPALEDMKPDKREVRDRIVAYHNFFRRKVRPSASNMLKMKWNKYAATQAQEYAEKCVWRKHNLHQERVVPELGGCGQNLFYSSQKAPWFQAIKSWFIEYKDFVYGAPIKDFVKVGHYTQMVWATSHQLGCGLAECSGGEWGNFFNYVCHYCPAGNGDNISQFPYKKGAPCAACPGHCEGNLCTNACYKSDFYGNCPSLTRSELQPLCEMSMCNATCQCDGKLHKNYPWK